MAGPHFINSSHGPTELSRRFIISGVFDLSIDPIPRQVASLETIRPDYRVPSEFVNHTPERIIVIRSRNPPPRRPRRPSTPPFENRRCRFAHYVPRRRKKIVLDRFPGDRGEFSRNIHAQITHGFASARRIIVGRETSVIYHKLRELLAEKLDGKLTRNAVIVLLNYSCRRNDSRPCPVALCSPARCRAMFNAPVSLTNLSERSASINAADSLAQR